MTGKTHFIYLLVLLCGLYYIPVIDGQFSDISNWFDNLFSRFFGDSGNSTANANNRNRSNVEIDVAQIEKQIKLEVGHLNHTLQYLLGSTFGRDFSRSSHEVSWCFEPELGNDTLNIFNTSMDFMEIALFYYSAFPEKAITHSNMQSLLNSTEDIISHCIRNSYRRRSVKQGFTELSDQAVDSLRHMLGLRDDSEASSAKPSKYDSQNENNSQSSGSEERCTSDYAGSWQSSYDWRNHSAVTTVKWQGNCSSSWALAATAAIESALLLNQKTLMNNQSLELSAQEILNCAQLAYSPCSGANSKQAFSYVQNSGISQANVIPYTGEPENCSNHDIDYYYPISGYCIMGSNRYSSGSIVRELSDIDIQRALLQFGPLYIVMNANPTLFRNYRSGVINDRNCDTTPNHAVLLVGYSSNYWILKNSWGNQWGEDGYFRLKRQQNMCGINTEIAWPLL